MKNISRPNTSFTSQHSNIWCPFHAVRLCKSERSQLNSELTCICCWLSRLTWLTSVRFGWQSYRSLYTCCFDLVRKICKSYNTNNLVTIFYSQLRLIKYFTSFSSISNYFPLICNETCNGCCRSYFPYFAYFPYFGDLFVGIWMYFINVQSGRETFVVCTTFAKPNISNFLKVMFKKLLNFRGLHKTKAPDVKVKGV